jgi:hypothetical protein
MPKANVRVTTGAATQPGASQPRPKLVNAYAPTRLLGGPVVFRVKGAPRTPPSNVTPKLRYALMFRLNRDPYKMRDGYAEVRDPRGNFSVLGAIAFTFDAPIETLDLRNCFIGYIDAEFTDLVRKLDALPLGAAVDVRLRPVTPNANGTSVLGRAYSREPPLLTTDYALKEPRAKAALTRIGCPVTDLGYYSRAG